MVYELYVVSRCSAVGESRGWVFWGYASDAGVKKALRKTLKRCPCQGLTNVGPMPGSARLKLAWSAIWWCPVVELLLSREARPIPIVTMRPDAEIARQLNVSRIKNGRISKIDAAVGRKLKVVHLFDQQRQALNARNVLVTVHLGPETGKLYTLCMFHDDVLSPDWVVRVVAPIQHLGDRHRCILSDCRQNQLLSLHHTDKRTYCMLGWLLQSLSPDVPGPRQRRESAQQPWRHCRNGK